VAGVLGLWDVKTPDPSMEHTTIAVSGAYSGQTVDFRKLAAAGMTLVGRAEAFEDGVMSFAPDLRHGAADASRGGPSETEE
jgi:putative flavoprotein involved in K+ transport